MNTSQHLGFVGLMKLVSKIFRRHESQISQLGIYLRLGFVEVCSVRHVETKVSTRLIAEKYFSEKNGGESCMWQIAYFQAARTPHIRQIM